MLSDRGVSHPFIIYTPLAKPPFGCTYLPVVAKAHLRRILVVPWYTYGIHRSKQEKKIFIVET